MGHEMGHRRGRRMVYYCPECEQQWFRIEERIGGVLLIYCGEESCGYYVGHMDIRAGIYDKEDITRRNEAKAWD
jgi:hypothetical protein